MAILSLGSGPALLFVSLTTVGSAPSVPQSVEVFGLFRRQLRFSVLSATVLRRNSSICAAAVSATAFESEARLCIAPASVV